MARETRSQTGNSKPRVVPVVDTAPTITRKAATKKKAVPKAEAKGAKPTGVTKKKSPVAKAKAAVKKTVKKAGAAEKKTEEKAEKAEKEAKPKTTTKKKETPVAK